jgi:hypothetical protein
MVFGAPYREVAISQLHNVEPVDSSASGIPDFYSALADIVNAQVLRIGACYTKCAVRAARKRYVRCVRACADPDFRRMAVPGQSFLSRKLVAVHP